MQPFTSKTVEVILISGFAYSCTYYLFKDMTGLFAIIGSTLLFSSLFLGLIYWRNITPDLKPIIATSLKKLGIKSGS